MKTSYITILLFVIACMFSCGKKEVGTNEKYDTAMLYYDSAYQCLVEADYLAAMPKLIKTAELLENLPEDMSDEEMNLTARAYYQMGIIFDHMFINSYETETMLRSSKYQEIRQDSTWLLRIKVKIALNYHVMTNIDSAEYYIKQIIPLSDSTKHFAEYIMTLGLIADNYYHKKEFDTAFYLHKEKINFKLRHGQSTLGDSIALGIIMFHSPYKYHSKPYLLKMFDVIATNPKANMRDMGLPALLLARLYEEEGNTDSVAICNKYLPALVNDMGGEKADEMTVKYMYEQFKISRDERLNEMKLQKDRKRNLNIIILCGSALLVMSAVILFIMRRKKSDVEWNYDDAMISFEQSDVVKRIKTVLTSDNGEKISVKNIEEFGDRKLANVEFAELRNCADKIFDGRITQLSEQYPELMPNDIYCCCLSLIGFTNSEMAVLFGVKYNAINSRISKVKKILDTEENLRDFMIKNLRG